MKICKTCKEEKPLSDFPMDKGKYRRPHCRSCLAKLERARYSTVCECGEEKKLYAKVCKTCRRAEKVKDGKVKHLTAKETADKYPFPTVEQIKDGKSIKRILSAMGDPLPPCIYCPTHVVSICSETAKECADFLKWVNQAEQSERVVA